jgi:hypothetical protein
MRPKRDRPHERPPPPRALTQTHSLIARRAGAASDPSVRRARWLSAASPPEGGRTCVRLGWSSARGRWRSASPGTAWRSRGSGRRVAAVRGRRPRTCGCCRLPCDPAAPRPGACAAARDPAGDDDRPAGRPSAGVTLARDARALETPRGTPERWRRPAGRPSVTSARAGRPSAGDARASVGARERRPVQARLVADRGRRPGARDHQPLPLRARLRPTRFASRRLPTVACGETSTSQNQSPNSQPGAA